MIILFNKANMYRQHLYIQTHAHTHYMQTRTDKRVSKTDSYSFIDGRLFVFIYRYNESLCVDAETSDNASLAVHAWEKVRGDVPFISFPPAPISTTPLVSHTLITCFRYCHDRCPKNSLRADASRQAAR